VVGRVPEGVVRWVGNVWSADPIVTNKKVIVQTFCFPSILAMGKSKWLTMEREIERYAEDEQTSIID